jgi:stage V sporulation protein R
VSALPRDLAELAERAREAATELGLDFPEVVFELVEPGEMNMVASFGGFPVRYAHWRHGMEFQRLHKTYEYGLSRIHELVVNSDPCYAYLLKTNTRMEQKLVMAHVFGHADFFRQSRWFAPTDPKMVDTMANHGTRVHRHAERFGTERVEEFLDACLSLENLIDPMSLYVKRHAPPEPDVDVDEERLAAGRVHRFPVTHRYMDPYINPRKALEEERARIAREITRRREQVTEPTRDLLGFLLHHAPLLDWQADCLDLVREEAYYFAPQVMTKVVNEGWATWVHSRLMTTRLLESSELVDYCDKHSGTLASSPGQLNPYRLGLALFKDVEDRWDRGAHGRAWRECDDARERQHWDTGAREGLRKVFEVRRVHNDVTFLDAFLTPEFIEREKLFVYGRDPRTGQTVVLDRDPVTVKRKLLQQFTNSGQPSIEVVDANYQNRGELYLVHRWDGVNLREDYARETLRALQRIWRRPVHVETVVDGNRLLWGFDGKDAGTRELGAVER